MLTSSLYIGAKHLHCLNDAEMLRLIEAFYCVREADARAGDLALAERYASANPIYAELKQHFGVKQ
jgi:hypothetical protein